MKFTFNNRQIKSIIIIIIILITSSTAYLSDNSNSKKDSKKKDNITINSNTKYKVTKVVDGDTFTISINSKKVSVRMIGVDTPETVDPRKVVQCFGKQASDKTKSLLLNNSVKLILDPSQGNFDKYNRVLAYVYRDDGLLINKYLIENGFAHEYTYNTPYKMQEEFKNAENKAREEGLGLWGEICKDFIK